MILLIRSRTRLVDIEVCVRVLEGVDVKCTTVLEDVLTRPMRWDSTGPLRNEMDTAFNETHRNDGHNTVPILDRPADSVHTGARVGRRERREPLDIGQMWWRALMGGHRGEHDVVMNF